MSLQQEIAAGQTGGPSAANAGVPRQRPRDLSPADPDSTWLREVALFRSLSRLRVQLLCHALLDEDSDRLADQLADVEARLTTAQPSRWELLAPDLLAEEASWWHEPGPPAPGCAICRRLHAGLTREQLLAIPVPLSGAGHCTAA